MPSPKPCLALVHGWGMNARVFDELAVLLAAAFEVRALDLPGHGGRDDAAGNTLRGWADELARQLPDNTILLGWSLGGQVAMRAALDHPHKIARLVLLASTPKFVAAEDWRCGMAPADLQEFGAALLADQKPRAALPQPADARHAGAKRCCSGCGRRCRHTPASAEALAGGLAMLRDTDLRAELPQLAQPVLVLSRCARHPHTPPAAGAWLAEALRAHGTSRFCRAAHAPHLSHADEVAAAAIVRFAHD